ncbi:PqqD family protein [Desulfosporosinus sp. OT]|uniref:PqqD family protein n=1 Tax=Desulfosporosinus sp. OT TaxID=913865 RepID=UPI0002D953F0|nr:PqqD family protein [Desulfosporosinus sp. OT]
MKIRDGFMLREIAGQWVVVPLGEKVVEFNGIMTLSQSGALLWQVLEKNASEEDLVEVILKEYTIDKETAETDVREFVSIIREKNLIN